MVMNIYLNLSFSQVGVSSGISDDNSEYQRTSELIENSPERSNKVRRFYFIFKTHSYEFIILGTIAIRTDHFVGCKKLWVCRHTDLI